MLIRLAGFVPDNLISKSLPHDVSMSEQTPPNIFWEIHSGLPREGPGDDCSTERAFRTVIGLPKNSRILDIGAGPGASSLVLARSSAGKVTAVDRHQPFLVELERRAREAGLAERITTLNASMSRLPFEDTSFDLIWSEGAIYMMGFRQGLTYWRRFLSPNGYIAVTEPCWLKKEIPDEARRNWAMQQ